MNDLSQDNRANNTCAAGAVLAALHTAGYEPFPVAAAGGASNVLCIKIPFMQSRYWVTVERVPDGVNQYEPDIRALLGDQRG